MGLLAIVVLVIGLVVELVARTFSQLESLSTGLILGPRTGKTVWLG